MDYNTITDNFLMKHNQHPDQISIDEIVKLMLKDMEAGLNGEKSSLMMIPTYLTTSGNFHYDEPVVVIDAGGTNLRVAAVKFTEEGPEMLKIEKTKMLGRSEPLNKEQFFQQLVDLILPYLSYSKKIGFCFSFPAEILPNKDGRIIAFCKEVEITGCEGALIGEEIKKELRRRKLEDDISIVILNDTVSTLLGGSIVDERALDGQIGLILGTGTNTAYVEKKENIKKLKQCPTDTMIINMESGIFNKVPQGDFDKIVDESSNNPTDHMFEKMISGVYLGNVICETIKQANKEGLFSKNNTIASLPEFTMHEVDRFLRAPFGDNLLANACLELKDKELLYHFIDKAIDRSSKLVTANIAADIIQMDGGKNMYAPVKVVMEGSTYHHCYSYKQKIDYYMRTYVNETLHRYYSFDSGDDVNLIGSAKAALINL